MLPSACKNQNITRFYLASIVLAMVFLLVLLIKPLLASEPIVSRLRSDDPREIEQVRKAIAADKGYSIVFLGDSAFFCSGTRDNRQTIPTWTANLFKSKLKRNDITVYNLSMPDCSMVNSLEILKYILAAKPDMVIFDLNIGWLGMYSKPHPALANLNAAVKDPALKPMPIPNKFPGTDIPWYKKDFSALKKARGRLADFSISPANQQWTALTGMIDLLVNSDTVGVMVYPPRNRTMYQRYNLLDDKMLQEKLTTISSLGPSGQIYYLDYTWRFHSNYFADNIHLLPVANRILAEMVCTDTIKLGLFEPATSGEGAKP